MSSFDHRSHHGRTGDNVSISSKYSRKSHRSVPSSQGSHPSDSGNYSRSRHVGHKNRDHLNKFTERDSHHSHHTRPQRRHDQLQVHHGSQRHVLAVYASCSCGTNLYSKMLGPTADETLLVGVQTLMNMFAEQSQSKRKKHAAHVQIYQEQQRGHHESSHHKRHSHHSKYPPHSSIHKSHRSHHKHRDSDHGSQHSGHRSNYSRN